MIRGAALVLALIGGASAQTSNAPESTPFQIGVEQRVRNENWNNQFDMSDRTDDQRNQIRWRTRFFADAPLPWNVDLHVGLAQETNQKIGKDNGFDEIFFETAYLDFRRLGSDRLRLRVGRQNFFKGDGFIFSEGGPQDGSRALYFNGVDLSYTAGKTQVELIGILDPKRDRFLPRIHDQHRLLVDWDDQALGVYLTRNLKRGSSLEGYYFIKKELHTTCAPSSPLFQPDRRVNTAGARTIQRLTPSLSITGEFAVQHGVQNPGVPVHAWGGFGYVKRTFKHRLHPYLKAGYWALSGSSRPDHTGDWDALFSRGAWYGDLNLYSEMNERGVGYMTNLKMAQMEAGFAPSKRLGYKFIWEHMSAFHPAWASRATFGTGLRRGENVQARADFTLNPSLRGHVDFETLMPGSFYTVADRAYFVRFEMIYQWTHRISYRKAHH
jgi:hypothetical protein